MKKLVLILSALALMVALTACRPIIGNPYTVTAGLLRSEKANWQSQTGPTYGSNNLNADFATVAANPSTYGYAVINGDVTVTSTSNNSLNHTLVNGRILVQPGTSGVFIYDVFVNGGCSNGSEVAAVEVPNNAVNDVAFMDVEIFPPSSGCSTPWLSHGIVGGDYSCSRCDIHGFGKQIYAGGDDILFVDSMAYDPTGEPLTQCSPGACRHVDSIFAQGSTNVQVKHSWIDGTLPSTTCCPSGFLAGSTLNLVVTDSWVAGDKAIDMSGPVNNATITNNVFAPTWYAVAPWSSGSGNVFSGNKYENGQPCNFGAQGCTYP